MQSVSIMSLHCLNPYRGPCKFNLELLFFSLELFTNSNFVFLDTSCRLYESLQIAYHHIFQTYTGCNIKGVHTIHTFGFYVGLSIRKKKVPINKVRKRFVICLTATLCFLRKTLYLKKTLRYLNGIWPICLY